MNTFSIFRVEFKRLVKSRMFWLAAVLCCCSLLPGYFQLSGFFRTLQPAEPSLMNVVYLANPVLSGTFFGSLVWAVFAAFESDRVHRSRVDSITEAIVSPARTASARLLTMAALAAVVCALCAFVHLPYISHKLDYLFDLGLYARSFLILPLATWMISFTLAQALYQITRRAELTGFIYAALVLMCFNEIVERDYFARWINPIVLSYSDGFSSDYSLRIALYTRALWLALAGGLWFLSAVCLRKYQKGLLGSFLYGTRKALFPASALVLSLCGGLMWIRQPIVNRGPAEMVRDFLPETSAAVISYYSYDIKPDVFWGSLKGTAEYTVSKDESGGVPDIIQLNSGYRITSMTLDGQPLAFKTSDEHINDFRNTAFELPAGSNRLLRIEYEGFPQEARYSSPNLYMVDQINPDYVQLRNTNLLPHINAGRGEPARYEYNITLPGGLTPMGGSPLEPEFLTDFTQNPDGTKTWTVSGETRISEIHAADYTSQKLTAAGVNIDFIYTRAYESMIAGNDIRGMMEEVMAYCINTFGRIDWMETGDGSDCKMIQTKDLDASLIGYVHLSESKFNTASYDGGYKGDQAAEIFAHETVHQWWGGATAVMDFENLLWTPEGLTVYTTYRLIRDKYGELYAKQYYLDRWQAMVDAQNRSFYNRYPEIRDALPDIYQARIDLNNSTTDMYFRMPLMIYKAERLVGGTERMDEILRELFKNHSGDNFGTLLTYQSFLDACGLRAEDLEL